MLLSPDVWSVTIEMSLARTLLRKSQQITFVRRCGLLPKICFFAFKPQAQDRSLGKSMKLGNHFCMNKKSMWSKYRYVTHLPLVTANCHICWKCFIQQSNKQNCLQIFSLIGAPESALLRLRDGKHVEGFFSSGVLESIGGHYGFPQVRLPPTQSQPEEHLRSELKSCFSAKLDLLVSHIFWLRCFVHWFF